MEVDKMVTLGELIGKAQSPVTINTNDEYKKLCMEISAEWENIVNSPMILRDDDGNRLYLRHDERIIPGVDY